MRAEVSRLRRFGHAFLQLRRRLPTAAEVAAGLGLTPVDAAALTGLTHAPLCAEDVNLGALPRLVVAAAGTLAQVRRVLLALTPREEAALRVRFGIGEPSESGAPAHADGAQDFEVTRERIRPIEASALRKLRHPSRSRALKTFVEE